jgi:UDP-N-acetylmuramate dehydrogenase
VVIQEKVPLAPLTTFKVGGPARYFVEATSEKDVIDAVTHAVANNLRTFVLGGGSNLLISDEGFPGLVIKIAIRGIEQREVAGKREYVVGAGEDWDAFVAHTVAQNCAGIENLSGIPGTVGGTPVQNVGAYGQEVSETITNVRVLDLRNLQVKELKNEDCGFAYRTSIFNSTERGRYIVLQVTFALTLDVPPNITYVDLKKRFANAPAPTLQQVRDAVREIRLSKGMLIVPNDEDCRSAGSFFKNPIVPTEKYDHVKAIARSRGADREPPQYPAGDGMIKLSAAWLVENAGFQKGYQRGPAGISKRHTLAIINRGGASAADILALKEQVQRTVKEVFGIELHPEPVFI